VHTLGEGKDNDYDDSAIHPGFLLLFSAVLVLSSGCTSQDRNVVRIGAAGPMTGDQSKMGHRPPERHELAVDGMEREGRGAGKKIELLAGG